MAAKWPALSMPKGSKLDNDKSHGHTDPNSGGGPAAPVVRNAKSISNARRGGPYQSGQRQYSTTDIHGGRGGSGNPANRGGMPSVGRQSFPSETRVPGHGGSPQTRSNIPPPSNRGGFGQSGQTKVITGPSSNPQPSVGNTSGRMATRITGRFNQKSKGAKAGGNVGSYGDRAPVTANT
jgi:hypothetical protein